MIHTLRPLAFSIMVPTALTRATAGAVIFSLSLMLACDGAPATPAAAAVTPVRVDTVSAHAGKVSRVVTLPSFRILPLQGATMFARVAGYVREIPVDKGDEVKAGQLLASLDVPELTADEIQFKAEASVARGSYERLAEAMRRSPDLVVPQTVDDMRGRAEVAEARLERTRAMLQFARVTAPFDGVVTARFVDAGAFIPAAASGSVPQSAAIVIVMDFSRVRVQVFVPEAEAPYIHNGIPVTVSVAELSGRSFTGTVTRYAQVLDEATKTMLAEIEMPNPSRALRPGMYANVRLAVEHRNALVVLPSDAILRERTNAFVFTIVEGRAKKTPVRIGFSDGVTAEIVEGLATGTPVIRLGARPMADGQLVEVVTGR